MFMHVSNVLWENSMMFFKLGTDCIKETAFTERDLNLRKK